MKLWIIGKQGMLGQAFCTLCEEKNIPFIASSKHEADITNLDSLKQFASGAPCTHIINCAAYTAVDLAESEPEKARLINVNGVKNLGTIANELGAKLVHYSTDYVFNGLGSSPYHEEDLCDPLSVYGKTKFEGELILKEMQVPYCIIRTSWLFGSGGKHFVQTIMRLMQTKEELEIVADQTGRPTYSKDLVKFTFLLLSQEGVFHFANQGNTTWYAFAKEIYSHLKLMGMPVKCQTIKPVLTECYPTVARRPPFSVLSTQKLEKTLQIAPRDWQESLKEYLEEEVPCGV
ncbi:MAG: dTDP-4-dehydrorhamnose reductase [Simkaniaceae bacterium]|nr:dTDP-4-dehydrorhamnose reductase [Simkaniaceae bacterium]